MLTEIKLFVEIKRLLLRVGAFGRRVGVRCIAAEELHARHAACVMADAAERVTFYQDECDVQRQRDRIAHIMKIT